MKNLVSVKLSPHKYKTSEGYLLCQDAIIARTGKQTYMKSELYPGCEDGDKEIEVERPINEVTSPATIASFEDKPLTDEHPDENVCPENYAKLAKGHIKNVRVGGEKVDGEVVLLADILVTDPTAIEEIENGDKTDLSCGYDCDLEGDENHLKQVHIRGNHLALCECGRAGCARIVDSKIKDEIEQITYKGFVISKMIYLHDEERGADYCIAKDQVIVGGANSIEEAKNKIDKYLKTNNKFDLYGKARDSKPLSYEEAKKYMESKGLKLDRETYNQIIKLTQGDKKETKDSKSLKDETRKIEISKRDAVESLGNDEEIDPAWFSRNYNVTIKENDNKVIVSGDRSDLQKVIDDFRLYDYTSFKLDTKMAKDSKRPIISRKHLINRTIDRKPITKRPIRKDSLTPKIDFATIARILNDNKINFNEIEETKGDSLKVTFENSRQLNKAVDVLERDYDIEINKDNIVIYDKLVKDSDFSRKFYSKAIKQINENMDKLDDRRKTDSNHNQYARSRNNLFKTYHKTLSKYEEKLNDE